MIRKFIHREKEHHLDLTEKLEEAKLWLHVNHCLLSLKNLVECKSDVTPVVLGEAGGSSKVGAWTLRDAPRLCKSYGPLIDAVRERKLCSSSCNADEIYDATV